MAGGPLNPGEYWVKDLFAFNDTSVYAGSVLGFLLTTQSGGSAWEPSKKLIRTGESWQAIDFINQEKGWAAGGNDINGYGKLYKLKKRDTGWQVQTPSINTGAGVFVAINFIDSLTGWIVRTRNILHTSDGGQNWTIQPYPISDFQNFITAHFENKNAGWIAGLNGLIIHTTNGGKKWEQQNIFTNVNLLDIHFENSMQGWVIGDSGTIGYTRDGGKTWFPQQSPSGQNLKAVHFIDTNRGWIVGEKGTLLKTINGGKTWKEKSLSTNEELNTILFSSDSIGWLGGHDGTLYKYTASQPKTSFEYTIRGNTVQFHNTSISNSNFRWHFGNDSTGQRKSPSHTYEQKGIYQVCLIGENACGLDTTCRTLHVEQFGSTKNKQSELNFKIFPQPVKNKATIQYQVHQDLPVTFKLFNNRGQMVKKLHWRDKTPGTRTKHLPFEELPKGIYYYRLKAAESEQAGKILLQ